MKRSIARVCATLAAVVLVAGSVAGCGDATGSSSGSSPETPTESSASAESTASAGIEVHDVWVRATRGTEDPSMSAAFMVIDNDTDADVSLVSASSPAAGMAELHKMVAADDGSMMMQEADGGIAITAGRGKVLEPGGLHVMLMNVTDELAPGDEVELTLGFSDGSTQTLTAPVKAFTEEEDHYHSPGTDEDHDH